ncbi:MAG: YbaN family protein [Bdellovibrio sp.]|jgi:uncharacterized membrane protein YbaN (DUF454 family)
MKRQTYFVLGLLNVALGVLGAFLPLLPSTCFFIFGAYFFGQSSERMETWILRHPRFGPTVVQWRKNRSIPLSAKIMASLGMSLSFAILFFSGRSPVFLGFGGLILGISALYVWTRPTTRLVLSDARGPAQESKDF